MKSLIESLEEYVVTRRALGTRLAYPALALRQFVQFLEREGATHITTELALRWAKEPQNADPSTWASRLSIVRQFATWRIADDPLTEVPPRRLLRTQHRRKPPYIYSEREIDLLMTEAERLGSRTGLRALTFTTLIGLLAATGLRPGEALSLDTQDVDSGSGVLAIRHTKFDKSRYAPIDDSVQYALGQYAKMRDRLQPLRSTQAFFVSESGKRILSCCARRTFSLISEAAGIRNRASVRCGGRGPRLHDLRHTFVTRKLVDWYRTGEDVARKMPALATYLGHVNAQSTYWYIQAVPELLQLATERLTTLSKGGEL